MIQVYLLDFTLAYILDYAVCCASAASLGPKLAFHYMKTLSCLMFSVDVKHHVDFAVDRFYIALFSALEQSHCACM